MTDDLAGIGRRDSGGRSALERVPDRRMRLPIPGPGRAVPKAMGASAAVVWTVFGTSTALVRLDRPLRAAVPDGTGEATTTHAMTPTQRVAGWSTGEEITKAAAFVARYRDAWCRDGHTGREGILTAVNGRSAYLRAKSGVEFTCRLPALVVLRLPPPRLYRRVRYVGKDDAARRPPGEITELWAVSNGTLATVQPPTGPAWFALLADLERDLPTGPVAEWDDPPFAPDAQASGRT
ncbi:hypothetical protein ACIBSV_35090 [Embleya sp. NPDC050154]|uniref:hypothetical protein n=1 Tax=Embleya sp. NPDC050154 TaxID=3363988 RepID=UPI0037ACB562